MVYIIICQSLSVQINSSDELSILRIKCSWLYMTIALNAHANWANS